LWTSIKIKDVIMAAAFASWYNGNSGLHLIDCIYPCNQSC
jgi:hypothetical protein